MIRETTPDTPDIAGAPLLEPQFPRAQQDWGSPRWTAAGGWLAVGMAHAGSGEEQIVIVNVVGGLRRT